MLTVGAALLEAAERIGPPRGRADAVLIMSQAIDESRTTVVAEPRRRLTQAESARFWKAVDRCRSGEPSSYILGSAPFLDLDLAVDPSTLIPRGETELLAQWAIGRAERRRIRNALDVGTGSGALAIALARACPWLEVDATDVSPAALAVARSNSDAAGVGSRVRLHLVDLLPGPICGLSEKWPGPQLLVANLPYVARRDVARVQRSVLRHEPWLALFGGTDGLLPIRRLIRRIARAGLGPGLDVGFEIGAGQSTAVIAALRGALPHHRFRVGRDFGGHDRMVLAECRRESA